MRSVQLNHSSFGLVTHVGACEQSGTAVSKNADAIKKAQAAIALDLEGDDDEDDDENAKEDEVAEVCLVRKCYETQCLD